MENKTYDIKNVHLHFDVIKKTELSKDDIILVKIKSFAKGINAEMVGNVLKEHFPNNESIIIDDSIEIEFVKKSSESVNNNEH